MIYRAIGVMSGSSLDGLDVVYAAFEEVRGKWSYTIEASTCYTYDATWTHRLGNAHLLSAYEYLILDVDFARFVTEKINLFIETHQLQHKVQLIGTHGHTVFHAPDKGMTAQIGDAATIAAGTGINVVSQLRHMDVALGGHGAPIVPVGEQLLFPGYDYLLNIGGIANLSANRQPYLAFDICPANAVLNRLAGLNNQLYDDRGATAATGQVHTQLLEQLNASAYYQHTGPKSLSNTFSLELFLMVAAAGLEPADALRTYVAHIVIQVRAAVEQLQQSAGNAPAQLLVTGGGALNTFLVTELQQALHPLQVEVVVPDTTTVQYKEALIMALLGILRWREQNTVLSSVTGAGRDSIGGAVWIGQEA
jgi:anhydro-N-acetylmuramic acid kinase